MIDYGRKIKVGSGQLNVYTEGQGNKTIVFMAGQFVTSPVLEYRPLYRKLSDKCRIVVIEKSGYGESTDTGTPRTVENMVNESRYVLEQAGLKPPYVLVPHSYSGFEAIYWANTFPDEVEAVFSIDMGIPGTAIKMEKELPQDKKSALNEKNRRFYQKIQKRGVLARIVRKWTVDATGLMSSDHLTAEEKELYSELFYKNLSNDAFFEEAMKMTENAKAAEATGKLRVPAFFYISDMKIRITGTTWREEAIKYAESIGAKYQLTDQGHNMHSRISHQIVEDLLFFLGTI